MRFDLEDEGEVEDDPDVLFTGRLTEDGLLSLRDKSSIVLIASTREELDRLIRDA